jgi:ankyrin repeat protein/L-ascorbate metabolism protein UlaG (beta-lactamase superfamily)
MQKYLPAALIAILVLAAPLSRAAQPGEELHTLFENGETARILDMLAADPQLLKADMGDGMTPLHYGVFHGYVPIVDYSLNHGIDINIKDRRGLPPVWFSISGKQPAMLRKLIALGADLSAKNPQGDDLLFRAARAGDVEVFQILLDNGFRYDERNTWEVTPLQYALNADALDIVKLLVEKGADLNATMGGGMTSLHHAAMSRKAGGIHYLLDRGADINARNQAGVTPLLFCADLGNTDGVRALAMRGADVNAADANGQTPVIVAVKKGDPEIVGLLLSKGSNPNSVDSRTGRSLLDEAAARGHSRVVETLLGSGADSNARGKAGRTALSYALKHGNGTSAEVLRKAGVEDVPWQSNLDESALLSEPLPRGEAQIWYLKHSGWAIRTKSAFLVFDYWDNDSPPDEMSLANGHIRPEGLKGLPVYVFATHEHGDHFDPQILEWRKAIPNITYIFGFEPPVTEGVVTLGPRVQRMIGPLNVTTIKSNDAGVGFAVQVDGLTIFHAGDHANGKVEMADNDFFPEIDYLARKGIRPDIAFFLNMYGCGSTNPEAFQKGIFHAVNKLKIKAVLPMHGADREWVYGNLAEGAAKEHVKVQVGAASCPGDRFTYRKGALAG